VKEARSGLKAANTEWQRAIIFYCQGLCAYEAGQMKKAHALMDNALRLAIKENEIDIQGRALMWKGRIAAQLPNLSSQETESNITEGLALFTDLEIKPDVAMGLLFLGEHHAAISEPKQALVYLGKAKKSFASMGMDCWVNTAQKLVDDIDHVQDR